MAIEKIESIWKHHCKFPKASLVPASKRTSLMGSFWGACNTCPDKTTFSFSMLKTVWCAHIHNVQWGYHWLVHDLSMCVGGTRRILLNMFISKASTLFCPLWVCWTVSSPYRSFVEVRALFQKSCNWLAVAEACPIRLSTSLWLSTLFSAQIFRLMIFRYCWPIKELDGRFEFG